MKIRLILSVLILPLPWILRRFILCSAFGYNISKDAYIGRSIFSVRQMTLCENAKIGFANVIRNLDHLSLGSGANIGSFNWVYGYVGDQHFTKSEGRLSSLELAAEAALVSRHIIDCTDRVFVGEYSIIAGYRSQVLTHSISFSRGIQACAPINIGKRAFVGSGCVLTPGARVPDFAIVGAGSVFTASSGSETCALYAGNPATLVRRLDPATKFFIRRKGFVD